MIWRYLLCVLGILLAVPILAMIALGFSLPVTTSGLAYLFASSLVIVGLILAPSKGKYPFFMIIIGLLALAVIAGARLRLVRQQQDADLRLVTLPQGEPARWANVLIDEQDSLIFGEAIFHRIGGDSVEEHTGLTEALHTGYTEMRRKHGFFASPVVSTYLNLQKPDAFDAVIIEPETMIHPEVAIIFLHGYMGNVTAQCWEIAQAVGQFGAVTICPSTEWTGGWWQPEGQAILHATFGYLRGQGIERFYLGGFSNGGFGISRLISNFNEAGLRGLFFINGISNGASIRETGLPVLILQGTQDERVRAGMVRPIVEMIGQQATYIEVAGDHFMIMKQPKPVRQALTAWLESQEPGK